MKKTYSAKPTDVTRSWYVLDASEATLGRVSTRAAKLLLGKDKPMFTSHIDCGDYVIIVNTSKLKVTGNKMDDKNYYRHSMYPGGLHSRTLKEQMEINPNRILEHAIRGMLPNNKLLDDRLKRLKVYAGSDHNHEAQKPVSITLKKGKSE